VLHQPAAIPAGPTFHEGRPVAALAAERAPAATAADLAIQLQALLGQHNVLAADLMRSRIRGDDDFVQSANAALGKNTDDMSTLVGQLFGDAAAKAFAPMWSGHIVGLFAYAAALADHDDATRATAATDLLKAENELGDFFAGASKGRLPKSAARAAVAMHVQHLTQQADAYAAKDYAKADQIYRDGFEHTYDLGLALDDALLPAADRATLQQPVWRLRSQLGKLLAEHAVLIEDVTRAAVSGTPDFAAAGVQINASTQDLAAAIDTLFGAAAAKLSAVLGVATGHKLTDEQLGAALREHDQMLIQHADAYAAKDYAKAHDIAYQTYDHMFELARTLADAFGTEVAKRLPKGGAQTGLGGMAGVVAAR
jgi:hypothetical protein